MRFKVTVTEEMMTRAGRNPELVMLALCDVPMSPGDNVSKEYDFQRNQYVFSGQLPDTPEAERVVRMLTALAKGHPWTAPSGS